MHCCTHYKDITKISKKLENLQKFGDMIGDLQYFGDLIWRSKLDTQFSVGPFFFGNFESILNQWYQGLCSN